MQLKDQVAIVAGRASGLGAATARRRRLGRADEFASQAMHMIDNPCLNGEVVRLDAALRMAPE
jgi:hypothetical protein